MTLGSGAEALRDPSILEVAAGFVASNDHFTMSVVTSNPQARAKVLVIGWARKRFLLVWPIFLFSILSLAIGVLVGELAHSATLRVEVTSGVAGVLFCIEILMIWQAESAF